MPPRQTVPSLVVVPDTLPEADQYQELSDALSHAKQLIVLMNKMDATSWSEDEFRKAVKDFATLFENSGTDVASMQYVLDPHKDSRLIPKPSQNTHHPCLCASW